MTVAEVFTGVHGDLVEGMPNEATEVVFIEPQVTSRQARAIRMKLRKRGVIHSTPTTGEATTTPTIEVDRAASVEAKESTEVEAQMSGEAKVRVITEAEAKMSGEGATTLKINGGVEARGE